MCHRFIKMSICHYCIQKCPPYTDKTLVIEQSNFLKECQFTNKIYVISWQPLVETLIGHAAAFVVLTPKQKRFAGFLFA